MGRALPHQPPSHAQWRRHAPTERTENAGNIPQSLPMRQQFGGHRRQFRPCIGDCPQASQLVHTISKLVDAGRRP